MEADAVIGCCVLVVSIAVLCGLVVWSRRVIETIHVRKLTSVRDIVKELRHGR